MKDLRLAVVGVGHLGRHHARVEASLAGFRVVGIHGHHPGRAAEVGGEFSLPVLADVDEVAREAEAVVVATPTVTHAELARFFLDRGLHVLVEKPMTASLAEADDLVARARRVGRTLQVGHVERYNPAIEAALSLVASPRFIEVHRLGVFTARSLDIDVVLDLMIHDLDIVLSIDGSEAVQVDAVGVPVLTPRVDIANARLRFASGLIANLTASRVSAERVRKFRVFSPRTYISVDFAAREAQVHRLADGPGGPEIQSERTAAPDEEPLRRQLAAFVTAVRDRSEPVVSGADGLRALALAHEILARMADHK